MMSEADGNLFQALHGPSPDEDFLTLVSAPGVTIERIVSIGQASPPDVWFDQPLTEWVVVVTGAAEVLFEGEEETVSLKSGDYLLIPPHLRHRVAWTDPGQPTVWLAVHFKE
jgi:cupin 2 domain-containing protein